MTQPKKYRKKPVVIEAMQFTEEQAIEVYSWIEDKTLGSFEPMAVLDGDAPAPPSGVSIDPSDGQLLIATLEGVMKARLGDYVIRGVQGEFYPCKPDIFEATYDLVDAENVEDVPAAEDGSTSTAHSSQIKRPLLPQQTHQVVDEDSYEQLFEILDDEAVLRDGDGRVWLAWGTEDGEYWAVRPRDEDDGKSADGAWHPVGPVSIEGLPYPWLVVWPAVPYYGPTAEETAAAEATIECLRNEGGIR